MSRRDRRLWQSANSVAELGDLMARWLEGDIRSWPGYQPNYGPDDETTDLVPTLAALNRTGFLTDSSQPGEAGPGFDGAWWEKRAAVSGFVADHRTLAALLAAARTHRLITAVSGRGLMQRLEGINVTFRDGETMTTFGPVTRRELKSIWPTINADAYSAVEGAYQVTVAAPELGAAGQRMWPVLEAAVEEARDVAA